MKLHPIFRATGFGYREGDKKRLHSQARKVLTQIAADLQLGGGSYSIRSTMGGVAVAGEIALHADRLYLQILQSVGGAVCLLYRSCKNQRDYTGGTNHFVTVADLADDDRYQRLLTELRRLGEAPKVRLSHPDVPTGWAAV